MRRLCFSLMALLMATLTAGAQTSPEAKARVAEIRKMYAGAKEIMANKKKAEVPPDETVVTSNYMAPGGGPTKDVTHYYYSGEFDENLGNVFYTPYFITRKYNVGAREYYEEFLFDKGDFVFYFTISGNDETRYYWGPNNFFYELIKGQKQMDEVFATRLAQELTSAFNNLMNREF